MFTVYVYVLDTLADWEIGHVTAELHSKRFFQEGCAAGYSQNSRHFQRAGENHGRADRHPGLRP